jgi:hypothetical protein
MAMSTCRIIGVPQVGSGATDLVLTHNGLPDDEMGRGHEEGWKHFTGILAEGRRE